MASIKNLKKDIDYVLGDILDYAKDVSILKNATDKGDEIIDETFEVFDNLITKINAKGVENKKAHFREVNEELETKAKALVEKINSL